MSAYWSSLGLKALSCCKDLCEHRQSPTYAARKRTAIFIFVSLPCIGWCALTVHTVSLLYELIDDVCISVLCIFMLCCLCCFYCTCGIVGFDLVQYNPCRKNNINCGLYPPFSNRSMSMIDMRDGEESLLQPHSQARHELMHNQYNRMKEDDGHWQDVSVQCVWHWPQQRFKPHLFTFSFECMSGPGSMEKPKEEYVSGPDQKGGGEEDDGAADERRDVHLSQTEEHQDLQGNSGGKVSGWGKTCSN